MGFAEVKMKILIGTLFLLALSSYDVVKANSAYTVDGFMALDHGRPRRDVPPSFPPANTSALETTTSVPAPANTGKTTAANATTLPPAVVTQTPLLGYNGTGQRRYNLNDTVPKVSDPIVPELDNISYIFKETPETIKAERNLTNLTYDNHNFYNSSFIGNETYFDEYWKNITQPEYILHDVLSNSHRRATIIQLKFDFPFYGHMVRNVTVATGGFVYTGDHVHNWLAATQYIAPLMGNFDTSITNDSAVKLFDDGEKFTVLWEDVTLQEDVNKTFTFAATLYKNGDIVFAYKHIPIPVQSISDADHPVKVGISDAYLNDKILFYVRRKTIYEYHRVSFKNYEISNKTILKLTALPTCVQYNTCDACVNHNTGFNCMWCPNINKCSSGTDRNKQDWILRSCEKNHLSNGSSCPAAANVDVNSDTSNTAYTTDTQGNNHHNAVVNTTNTEGVDKAKPSAVGVVKSPSEPAHSPLGGVVAALLTVTLVCCLGAWLLYAFKNPHTRSGQLLIKYRPSQWSWRRGEARYTAATIHM